MTENPPPKKVRPVQQRTPLTRPRERFVAGVSDAVANHLAIPVVAVRLFFVIASAVFGIGALLYVWLWAFTPTAPNAESPEQPLQRKVPIAFILLALEAIAGLVLLLTAGASLPIWWIVLFTAAITASFWNIQVDKTDPLRTHSQRSVVQYGAPLYLVVFGIIVALRGEIHLAIELTLAFFSIAIGVLLLLTPAIIQRVQQRLQQQAEQARTTQHAEIAAHLHDSVLQTLALIQNRAGAASEVGRIARAQERELRDWLYSGSAPITQNLAAEVQDIANELELEYEVIFDFVAVGFSEADPNPDATSIELIAATREAMLNAARHAGGTVSVYLEGSEHGIDVYIRDRGMGFDTENLPTDRFGVKNSIIDRMRRVGGEAKVSSQHGQGTEIQLKLPRNQAKFEEAEEKL